MSLKFVTNVLVDANTRALIDDHYTHLVRHIHDLLSIRVVGGPETVDP